MGVFKNVYLFTCRTMHLFICFFKSLTSHFFSLLFTQFFFSFSDWFSITMQQALTKFGRFLRYPVKLRQLSAGYRQKKERQPRTLLYPEFAEEQANEDWNLKWIKVSMFLKFELFWINNKTIIIVFGFRMIWGIIQISSVDLHISSDHIYSASSNNC